MTITTPRLILRLLLPSDWQALKKITRDFAQSQYAIYDHPFPAEDEKLIEITKFFAETGMFYAVLIQETKEVIGYVCFHDDGTSYDLGYCFHSSFHQKGYAYEACLALMNALTDAQNITQFTAGTALNNIPSLKLLQKLGFELQYTEAASFHQDENGNDIIFEGGRFTRIV